ncbi:hypothetical protein ACLOJK_023238 [Asimina triloba]
MLKEVVSHRTLLEGDLAYLGTEGGAMMTESVHIERRQIDLRGVGLTIMLGRTGQPLLPEGSCGLLAWRGRLTPIISLIQVELLLGEAPLCQKSSFVISQWCDGSGRRRISGRFWVHFPTNLCGSLFFLRKPPAHLLHSYLSSLPSTKMTRKKGMITAEDLASLRSRYHITDHFELLAPSAGETFRSHREGCICLNE